MNPRAYSVGGGANGTSSGAAGSITARRSPLASSRICLELSPIPREPVPARDRSIGATRKDKNHRQGIAGGSGGYREGELVSKTGKPCRLQLANYIVKLLK
jgi:hypothetical protein